ncbi:MAG: membrane protein insertion efficiency factor YidD [Angustibacter sp.]
MTIRFYQLVISPWFPRRCRFYPTCSAYFLASVQRFGAVRGLWLGGRRLVRCHPWNPGGVNDVLPETTHPRHRNHRLLSSMFERANSRFRVHRCGHVTGSPSS